MVVQGLQQIATADPLQEENNELTKLIVPIDELSLVVEAGEAELSRALAGIVPKNKTAPTVSKASGFTLWGDLFKTGGCYAMADLHDWGGIAFTEWNDGKWKLRGLWKIHTIWRPAGWTNGGDDYFPIKPVTEPFMLEDLSGDRVPELIVAGSVDRNFQEHYLYQFSPKTNTLNLLEYAMRKPERIGDYVRLYFDSGRLSEFRRWEFLKWKNEKLVRVASWHSEVDRHEMDPSFVEGERQTKRRKHRGDPGAL